MASSVLNTLPQPRIQWLTATNGYRKGTQMPTYRMVEYFRRSGTGSGHMSSGESYATVENEHSR